MQPSRPPAGAGFSQVSAQSLGGTDALAGRASTLLQRIMDVERTLTVQEWWLLGRALREAAILAEVVSLLAVARGELEEVLMQSFGLPPAPGAGSDMLPPPPAIHPDDPEWVRAIRDQAIGLLRMAAAALPAMQQYAQMLRQGAERLNLPMVAVDAFGIVADRVSEAYETIAHPPL